MFRVASVIFPVVGTTLAGIGAIAALSAGYDTLEPLLIGVAIGTVVALPVTWIVAKKMI